MSGDPLLSDTTGGERRQFLPDLPQSLRQKERWRRGQNDNQIIGEEKRNGRLVGAVETRKERAEWRRLQQKNLNMLGLLKEKVAPVPQREQLARTPEPPLPKGTEPSVQSTRS